MERKPVVGDPQGYAVGASGAFRTIALRSRRNSLCPPASTGPPTQDFFGWSEGATGKVGM